jgi:DUF971 family protein/molybdopterin converting factor small subunit
MHEFEISVTPTEINLHRKSRLLEIAFSDGFRFQYPCEYLRVSCPGGAVPDGDGPVCGKAAVNIESLEPHGSEVLQLAFDDGYACSYSWAALHALGVNHEQNWLAYLQQIKTHGLQRGIARKVGPEGKVSIRLLYFIQLAKVSGKDDEWVEIPPSVNNVETLLDWLRGRGDGWRELFAENRVQVTVNKQFAEPYTLLEHGDEVALVPRPH